MRKIEQREKKIIIELSEGEYEALCRLIQTIPDYREGGITSDGIEVSSLLLVVLKWIQGKFYLEAMQMHLDRMKDLW